MTLDQAWQHFDAGTLKASWVVANPGEAAKLAAYRANGGTPPVLATQTGQAFVLVEQARRAELAVPLAVSILPPSTA